MFYYSPLMILLQCKCFFKKDNSFFLLSPGLVLRSSGKEERRREGEERGREEERARERRKIPRERRCLCVRGTSTGNVTHRGQMIQLTRTEPFPHTIRGRLKRRGSCVSQRMASTHTHVKPFLAPVLISTSAVSHGWATSALLKVRVSSQELTVCA